MTGKQVWVIALVVVIVVAGAAAVVWDQTRLKAASAPAAGTREALASATPPQALPASPSPVAKKPAAPAEALPPLLPGNPLTDEKFAAISAKIVIVAMGLKQDKNWEINTLLYMSKALDEAGVDEKQFKDYAEALHRNPDRGRAVAESIVSKAEKKLGYRMSMDKMPLFNLSPERVRKIDKELQKKLK